jgi:hypothetical protein
MTVRAFVQVVTLREGTDGSCLNLMDAILENERGMFHQAERRLGHNGPGFGQASEWQAIAYARPAKVVRRNIEA